MPGLSLPVLLDVAVVVVVVLEGEADEEERMAVGAGLYKSSSYDTDLPSLKALGRRFIPA